MPHAAHRLVFAGNSEEAVRQLFDAGEPLRHLTWLDGGRSLVTVERGSHRVSLWDVGGRRLAAAQVLGHQPIFLAAHPDGRRLATADYFDPRCRTPSPAQVWGLGPSGLSAEPLPEAGGFHGGLAFTPDGSALVGGAACEQPAPKRYVGRVRWWELGAGRWGEGLAGHAGLVRHLSFAPDGRRLVTYGGDRYVRVWDVAARREVGNRKVGMTFDPPFALSPDGRRLVVVVSPIAFLLLDPEAGPKLGKKPRLLDTLGRGKEPAGMAAFSPDGRVLALVNYGALHLGQGDGSGFIRVPDLDAVTGVAFSPDGLTLAAADERGRVWQIDID
jgi:WD40 repeat protein